MQSHVIAAALGRLGQWWCTEGNDLYFAVHERGDAVGAFVLHGFMDGGFGEAGGEDAVLG